jgi:hypothetical protein
MSQSISAFVREPIPTPIEVQDVARELGFEVNIYEPAAAFDSASGFRPMTFGPPTSLRAGVEIYVEDAREFARENGVEIDPGFTRVISFRWGSSFEELYSALVICSALARVGAKVWIDDEGVFTTAEEVLSSAEETQGLIMLSLGNAPTIVPPA